jgi:hypothetical protein
MNSGLKIKLLSTVCALSALPSTSQADSGSEIFSEEQFFNSSVFVNHGPSDPLANPKGSVEQVYDALTQASSAVKGFVGQKVQTAVEDHIHATAVKAGELANRKIFNFFFEDKERYGMDAEDRRVTILMNRSQALNSLFKFTTGQTIDETIAQLPVGMSHLANHFKAQLEKLVVTQVISRLGSLGVEATVENALLAGYGYAKNAVFDATKQGTQKPALKTQQDLQFEKIISEFEEESARAVSEAFSDAQLNDIYATKSGNKITLNDVLDDYKVSMIEKLNQYFNGILIDVVTTAADEAAQQSIKFAAAKAKTAAFGAGVATGFFNPTAAIAMIGGGALLGEYTDTLAHHAGGYAARKAENIANHNLGDLISPDYAKQDARTTHTRIVDLGSSWMDIDFQAATLAAWAEGQLKVVEEVAVDTVDTVADGIVNLKNNAAEFLDNAGDAFDMLHGYDPAPREEREEFTTGGWGKWFVTGVKRFFSDVTENVADNGDYLYGEGDLTDYDARQDTRDLDREKLGEVRKAEDTKQAQELKAKQDAIKLQRQAAKTEMTKPQAKGWFSWW